MHHRHDLRQYQHQEQMTDDRPLPDDTQPPLDGVMLLEMPVLVLDVIPSVTLVRRLRRAGERRILRHD